MPLHPVHVPGSTGLAALGELSRVPWSKLAFAYHYQEHPGLEHDIEATLQAFAEADWGPAFHAIYANVVHQRTVYEATAYAVPFIAALAAGADVDPLLRIGLSLVLVDIALSSSFETEDGSFAGSFGEGVAESIRAALLAAKPRLDAIAALEPTLADVFPEILAIAAEPTRAAFDTLLPLRHRTDRQFAALDDAAEQAGLAPLPRAVPAARYRHPKLGEATLVRIQENGLLLRFDDGKERVIQERFVTLVAG